MTKGSDPELLSFAGELIEKREVWSRACRIASGPSFQPIWQDP